MLTVLHTCGLSNRPDLATRSALAKKASDLAEAARVAIRAMRHQGQKDLKTDQDNKVIGTADARKDGQKVPPPSLHT